MNNRQQILSDLKGALAQGDDGMRQKAVADRMTGLTRHVIPVRGQPGDQGNLADRFQAEAEKVHATVTRVAGMDAVPQAAADYLAEKNLPASLRVTPDARLKSAPWDATTLDIKDGVIDADDTAGISHAFGGVAETGTMVFLSGPDNPTPNNYLPPVHIAVVRASDLMPCYEDAWAKIRETNTDANGRFMPRTVNWITGPSRTADIELTLFLGIHGPKDVHIILVEDDER